MTIPVDKQEAFVEYCRMVLGPTWKKYGVKKHECYRVAEKAVVGRQMTEENRFIERLYFDDNFNIPNFYKEARQNEPEKVRSYEEQFGASQIELRILEQVI